MRYHEATRKPLPQRLLSLMNEVLTSIQSSVDRLLLPPAVARAGCPTLAAVAWRSPGHIVGINEFSEIAPSPNQGKEFDSEVSVATGKVDQSALLEPASYRLELDIPFVASSTAVQMIGPDVERRFIAG